MTMDTRLDNPFGILTYHRVAPRFTGVSKPTWNVTPERFRRQLAGLLSRGYRCWPLRQVLEHREAGRPIPPRVFVVTFDDGYECVYHHAWPILKELSVPATVFVVTSCLDAGGPMPFDDWPAAGAADVPAAAWKSLSTAQCAEMLAHGLVDIGSHTHTHGDFSGRPEAFRDDLNRSLNVLRDSLGVQRATFAFPFGCCDPDLVAAARESGVTCCAWHRVGGGAAAGRSFHVGAVHRGRNRYGSHAGRKAQRLVRNGARGLAIVALAAADRPGAVPAR